jgi:hypothetical protein
MSDEGPRLIIFCAKALSAETASKDAITQSKTVGWRRMT